MASCRKQCRKTSGQGRQLRPRRELSLTIQLTQSEADTLLAGTPVTGKVSSLTGYTHTYTISYEWREGITFRGRGTRAVIGSKPAPRRRARRRGAASVGEETTKI